ncbi:sugar phosphate isomerase/epimerase family protein [Georgenia sp. MJ170]|uniref:sugar phosphate isomerase/epimerase family protein n=1 Tax=Georgenia sunbinii TaxID=3117728 RepID=UPI002F26C24D
MSLRLSYGTSGFADHSLPNALSVIAELGYDGVALTLDHHHLDPFAPDAAARVDATAGLLARHGLAVAIETGARYLLDPWHKHEPTLVSTDGQERRLELLHRAIDIAGDLGTDIVHMWSGGVPEGTSVEVAWDRLLTGMADLLPHAEEAGVRLAFEPEPGMLVERLADVQELRRRLGSPEALRMTVDVGHAICNEDAPPQDILREVAEDVVHIQIEDMRRGVHEHLEFGEGEIDLPAVIGTLIDIEYTGLVSVELGRHSATVPTVAARSIDALRAAIATASSRDTHHAPEELP